ncbi:MAG: hypothetical protein OQJ96_13530 [Flavobacteriales bacterium]|nr:hypothetical protein [Flavobacteriales bacterium]MCW8912882.1 hypothetical protein [Flavobacteriales bacterium]MCW8937231.1 hypothetical protein [Flavobacteriales bacterium]MCW8940084.1 hypothetical protein [Flavobacteriales bacterium]MCW8967808.1 hypothetical protein [Flavobacteriales bacterium]
MAGKSFYSLRIACEEYIYNEISSLLQVQPKDSDSSNTWWIYEVVEKEDDEYYDFISNFLDLLEGKYSFLEKLEISRKDITIWRVYEYDDQCNMEYDAEELKRLGENGINLCISCYQASDDDEDWKVKR